MRKVMSLLFGLVLPRATSKSGINIMVRTSIIAAASVAVLALSPSAFAQMAKYGCPCRKLNPHILMVQSAQDWQRQNAAHGLDGTRYRRILVQ